MPGVAAPAPRSEELLIIGRGSSSAVLELRQDATLSTGRGPGAALLPVQATGVLHLTKGIVGTGCLSLPNGVSTLAGAVGENAALPMAMFLLVGCGAVAAHTYKEVAASAAETGSASFAEAFGRSNAGPASVAAWTAAVNCLGGCIMIAMILGDSATAVLQQAVAGEADAAGLDPQLHLHLRFLAIAASCGLMWPACAKLDMSAMGWSSLLGVSATALTACVMVTRLLDGSYTDPSGQFVGAPAMEGISAAAQDPDPLGAVGAVLFLVSLLANSFIAHQCAPQLRRAVDADVTAVLPEGSRAPAGVFDGVVSGGFAFSSVVYALVIACGFLTFGLNARENVLDGYAANDPLAAAARLATAVWLACSFPQMLLGLRDSLRDLISGHKELEVLTSTPLLLFAIALLAGTFTDLSTVMAMQGAVLGALLVFVLPGLMLAARQGGDTGSGIGTSSPWPWPWPSSSSSSTTAHSLVATGTLIGAGGLCAAGLHAASAAVSP